MHTCGRCGKTYQCGWYPENCPAGTMHPCASCNNVDNHEGQNPFRSGRKAVNICHGPGCTFGVNGVVHGQDCVIGKSLR